MAQLIAAAAETTIDRRCSWRVTSGGSLALGGVAGGPNGLAQDLADVLLAVVERPDALVDRPLPRVHTGPGSVVVEGE
eukprot:9485745-Pyramimonas_sp.AAC.1